MKGKLIRLGVMLAVTVLFYFLGVIFDVNPLIFLAPAILALVNVLIWDLLKFDLLDKGFFRFLKFVALIAVFVVLLLLVFNTAMPMINEELFDIKNTMTDLQICSICGAVGSITFTYCLCFGVAESFGNRNIGPAIPVIGVVFGTLYGFVGYIGGALSIGFAKVLVCLPIAFAALLTFSHIKEYGLLYEDMPMGAGFRGLGSSKKKGSFKKTGRPIEDAMNLIAWNESKQTSLYHNNTINVEVNVTVYSYTIEFEISGRVYINNNQMNASQVNEVNQQVNNLISNLKTRISNRAQKDLKDVLSKNPNLNQSYNISVKVNGVDCV